MIRISKTLLLLILICNTALILTAEKSSIVVKKEILLDESNIVINQPHSILVDKQGNIFLLDTRPSRIYHFDKNGKYIKTIADSGNGPGELGDAKRIVFNSDNNIVFYDLSKFSIVEINREGKYINSYRTKVYGYKMFGGKNGKLYLSVRAVKGACRFYVINPDYSPGTCLIKESGISDTGAMKIIHMSLDYDSMGNIYITEPLIFKIHFFTADGKVLPSFGTPPEGFKEYKKKYKPGMKWREWFNSFCHVDLVITYKDKLLAIETDCLKKRDTPKILNLYDFKNKELLTSFELDPSKRILGKSENGDIIILRRFISDDGAEVKFYVDICGLEKE